MSEVHAWSTTAASNNSASPNGWPEGMAPSGVNDSARENMAAIAKYRSDTDGVNSSTGSANAYVLAASRAMTAYAQGDLYVFKANFINTGAATLNVDSLGAKSITKDGTTALAAGDIPSGAMVAVVYDGTQFQLISEMPVTAARGNSLVLLETETASASTSLDFVLNTAYDDFILLINNLKPATADAALWLRLSSDNVTFFSSGYRWVRTNVTDAPATSIDGSSSDAKIMMLNAVGGTDGKQASGQVRLRAISALGVRAEWTLSTTTLAGVFYQGDGAGAYEAAAAGYARLLFSTGNITSGVARLYGVKKSL